MPLICSKLHITDKKKFSRQKLNSADKINITHPRAQKCGGKVKEGLPNLFKSRKSEEERVVSEE